MFLVDAETSRDARDAVQIFMRCYQCVPAGFKINSRTVRVWGWFSLRSSTEFPPRPRLRGGR